MASKLDWTPLVCIPEDLHTRLNRLAFSIRQAAAALETLIAAAEGEIDVLQSEMDVAQAEIDALQAADVVLDSRLDTAEADITALEAVHVALDARLDTAEADINTLEARNINSGNGLTGGGNLTADLTLNVVAGDATIVVGANSIVAGVMQTANLANDSVTNAVIRNSGPVSVIGRSANTTGDRADISATAGLGQVLRESGNVLGFGTVATAGHADDSITDAKLRNGGACSVIGRSAASTGDPADISASTNGHFLSRQSNALGFAAIALGDLPSTVVRGGGSGVANRLALFSDSNTLTSDADITFDGSDLAITNRINTSNPGTTLFTALGLQVNVGGSQTIPRVMLGPTQNVGYTTHFFTFRGRNGTGACTLTGAAVGDVVRFVQGMQLGLEGNGLDGQYETTISVANQIQQVSASNLTALNWLCVLERRSSTGATTERILYVVP